MLIDVAPSITLSQQCAMVYAQQVLVPVGMETLSLQGAVAAVNAAEALNRFFKKGLNVRTVAILPGADTDPDEVAQLVAYLASPAGDYFSGCKIELRTTENK